MPRPTRHPWLNTSVFSIGIASLFCDLGHETTTAILPVLMGSLGVAAVALGTIEGVADGLSSAAKLYSGWLIDRLERRKPLAVSGYAAMTLGSALIAVAAAWPVVLAGRVLAWVARGLRTPARKVLLAEAVTPETYGRAFGFERSMDTIGAIAAPLGAMALLAAGWPLRKVLWLAVLPALIAAGAFAFGVREVPVPAAQATPFWPMLRALPPDFRRLLRATGVFGAGDFAVSLVTLYAIRALAPGHGTARAATLAVGLYAWRNIAAAGVSFPVGWLADHWDRRLLLAAAYASGVAMAVVLAFGPSSLPALALAFTLSGIAAGAEEVLEDAVSADLLSQETRGTGFGVLAAVKGAGDFISSIAVGALWAAAGAAAAFGVAAGIMTAGTALVFAIPRFRSER